MKWVGFIPSATELSDIKNKPILITGCQRSGTTLLNLILDSHPEIHGVDEMEFKYKKLSRYFEKPEFYPRVSLKLPTFASSLSFVNALPNVQVFWCVRDPRDVVASMMRLRLPLDQYSAVSWAAHPLGSHREIDNCLPVLEHSAREKLLSYIAKYNDLSKKEPSQMIIDDLVFTGALCWRVKNELLHLYRKTGIPFKIVWYEKLVRQPRIEIESILKYAGMTWHEIVMTHHLIHSGISVGGTNNSRPIDSENTGKWRMFLDEELISIVKEVCADLAKEFGYDL